MEPKPGGYPIHGPPWQATGCCAERRSIRRGLRTGSTSTPELFPSRQNRSCLRCRRSRQVDARRAPDDGQRAAMVGRVIRSGIRQLSQRLHLPASARSLRRLAAVVGMFTLPADALSVLAGFWGMLSQCGVPVGSWCRGWGCCCGGGWLMWESPPTLVCWGALDLLMMFRR